MQPVPGAAPPSTLHTLMVSTLLPCKGDRQQPTHKIRKAVGSPNLNGAALDEPPRPPPLRRHDWPCRDNLPLPTARARPWRGLRATS